MNTVNSDHVALANQSLYGALEADFAADPSQWTETVHDELGCLVDAIQEKLRGAELAMADIGEINPDLQNAPTTDRHKDKNRQQLIKLAERIYQLRADIRQADGAPPLDLIQIRLRGLDILTALKKVREADEKFLVEAINSNPGAGE